MNTTSKKILVPPLPVVAPSIDDIDNLENMRVKKKKRNKASVDRSGINVSKRGIMPEASHLVQMQVQGRKRGASVNTLSMLEKTIKDRLLPTEKYKVMKYLLDKPPGESSHASGGFVEETNSVSGKHLPSESQTGTPVEPHMYTPQQSQTLAQLESTKHQESHSTTLDVHNELDKLTAEVIYRQMLPTLAQPNPLLMPPGGFMMPSAFGPMLTPYPWMQSPGQFLGWPGPMMMGQPGLLHMLQNGVRSPVEMPAMFNGLPSVTQASRPISHPDHTYSVPASAQPVKHETLTHGHYEQTDEDEIDDDDDEEDDDDDDDMEETCYTDSGNINQDMSVPSVTDIKQTSNLQTNTHSSIPFALKTDKIKTESTSNTETLLICDNKTVTSSSSLSVTSDDATVTLATTSGQTSSTTPQETVATTTSPKQPSAPGWFGKGYNPRKLKKKRLK